MTKNEEGDEVAKAAAIRLIDAGLYDVFFDVALKNAAPIYWYRRDDRSAGGRPRINYAATTFFVDTGVARFGVTAKHVLQRAIKAGADPAIVCMLGNAAFDPRERLIAESDADVATFSVDAKEFATFGWVPHQPPGAWPPPPPEEGKGVFFGGFRGGDRTQEGRNVTFGFAAGVGVATDVHRDGLTIEFDRKSWVCQERWTPPKPGQSWGGTSGGAVYALQKNLGPGRPDLHAWRLAGLISQAHDDWEVIRVASLWNVNLDGTIGA